ncbi:hypothetical protein [Dyella japonica]|uniref:hypothetical protein n=1 Tax=Dyella japonica TaxID=231455 RepID=UPI00069BD5CE|nr:hypothetical protein [Dyella japonica]
MTTESPDLPPPTEEGRLRYAGGYNLDFDPPIPCTCNRDCKSRCAGECGCEACSLAFAAYADICGWYGEEPFVPTEKHLQQYRDVLGPSKGSNQ